MRRAAAGSIALVLVLSGASPAWARAAWKTRIDRIIGGRPVGVAVRESGRVLYRHGSTRKRIPASNQKLLMSMALLDRVGAELQIETDVAASSYAGGIVTGDLWMLGHGDPTMSSERRYTNSLRVPVTKIRGLARAIRDAGVERIEGSVIGDTGYFARDWFAPGWKANFPSDECPLPSALTINGNTNDQGRHVADPEVRAARALTRRLEKMGIRVTGPPATGQAPAGLTEVAQIESAPLSLLLQHVNRNSSNFFAEVFGKRLGVEARGRPGTIEKGASAIMSWASRNGAELVARDSSGLSYDNRVSPLGLVRLLGYAEDTEWGEALRDSLADADQGTLEGRLNGVRVRAKTGTLDEVSALTGYVWMRSRNVWAEFSILSGGMPKSTAASIENRIVRVLARDAR